MTIAHFRECLDMAENQLESLHRELREAKARSLELEDALIKSEHFLATSSADSARLVEKLHACKQVLRQIRVIATDKEPEVSCSDCAHIGSLVDKVWHGLEDSSE